MAFGPSTDLTRYYIIRGSEIRKFPKKNFPPLFKYNIRGDVEKNPERNYNNFYSREIFLKNLKDLGWSFKKKTCKWKVNLGFDY